MRVHTTKYGQKQIRWGLHEKLLAHFSEPCLVDHGHDITYCSHSYGLISSGLPTTDIPNNEDLDGTVIRAMRRLRKFERLPLVAKPSYIAGDKFGCIIDSPHKGLVSFRILRTWKGHKKGQVAHVPVCDVRPMTEVAVAALMRLR